MFIERNRLRGRGGRMIEKIMSFICDIVGLMSMWNVQIDTSGCIRESERAITKIYRFSNNHLKMVFQNIESDKNKEAILVWWKVKRYEEIPKR